MSPAAKTTSNVRYPSPRLNAVRRASLAGMAGYSRFVHIMQRLLPVAAAAVALAVLAYALQPRELPSRVVMSSDGLAQIDNDLTMVHPRLFGTGDDGSPFQVVADTAVQDGPTMMRIRLNTVRAQTTMKDGLWVRLNSLHGYVNRDKHELDLTDGVVLTADGGYEAHSPRAHFDLTTGIVTGNEPVAGRGPYGTFTAHGFTLHKEERQLVLTGGVSMLLHAAQPKVQPGSPPQ